MKPSADLWEEALAQVPGAQGEARLIEALAGTSNATWRVRTRQGCFVVRLHDPWASQLGVDRGREAQLHAAAAGAGLAPPIIAADPAGRFLVTGFIAGYAWQAHDMSDVDHLHLLARRLGELHALPPPAVAPWDLGKLLAAHVLQVTATAGEDRAQLLPLVRRAGVILQEAAAAGRSPCIVHNDLNHANLVGMEPMIVDWEYAAVADPLSDLACMLAYYPEAERYAPLLLAESGLGAVPVERLQDLAWVYLLVSWLWYRRYELDGRLQLTERAAMQTLWRRLG